MDAVLGRSRSICNERRPQNVETAEMEGEWRGDDVEEGRMGRQSRRRDGINKDLQGR